MSSRNAPAQSDHHLACRGRNGSDHPDNIRTIRHNRHEAHHTLFHDLLPHEIIAEILQGNRSILKGEWIGRIVSALGAAPEDIYLPQAFKSRKALEDLRFDMRSALRRLLEEDAEPDNGKPAMILRFPAPHGPRAS